MKITMEPTCFENDVLDAPGRIAELREASFWVYELFFYSPQGKPVPYLLQTIYIGVTNNPVARLIEHRYSPHSDLLEAMVEWQIEQKGYELGMHLCDRYDDREDAECAEQERIQIVKHDEGPDPCFPRLLLNMNGCRMLLDYVHDRWEDFEKWHRLTLCSKDLIPLLEGDK